MTTNTATKLDSQRVETIFLDCLFKEGEDTSNHIKAEGITRSVGFHPDRLAIHKDEISALLGELSDDFKKSVGGGMSFLNACNDKHGNQWTDLHQRMEQLFQLGLGIGKVECLLSRDMWEVLPGGMPYYVIISTNWAARMLPPPTRNHPMSLKSIQLYNIAVWHLEQADKCNHEKSRERHLELADRFFILAHWSR